MLLQAPDCGFGQGTGVGIPYSCDGEQCEGSGSAVRGVDVTEGGLRGRQGFEGGRGCVWRGVNAFRGGECLCDVSLGE